MGKALFFISVLASIAAQKGIATSGDFECHFLYPLLSYTGKSQKLHELEKWTRTNRPRASDLLRLHMEIHELRQQFATPDQINRRLYEFRALRTLERMLELNTVPDADLFFEKNQEFFSFIPIPSGGIEFEMDKLPSDDPSANKTKNTVTLNESFYILKYPVTQLHYFLITGKNPSSDTELSIFKGNHSEIDPYLPVTHLTLKDINAFIQELNSRTAEVEYRLPTDAEWYYVATEGATAIPGTHPSVIRERRNYPWVNTGTPNKFGVFDIDNHVPEWTGSRDFAYNWNGPNGGPAVIIRGRFWSIYNQPERISRSTVHPTVHDLPHGFRLVAIPR